MNRQTLAERGGAGLFAEEVSEIAEHAGMVRNCEEQPRCQSVSAAETSHLRENFKAGLALLVYLVLNHPLMSLPFLRPPGAFHRKTGAALT